MSLVIGIATVGFEGATRCVRSWQSHAMFARKLKIVCNMRVVDAYQKIYQETKEGVIGYIHDDVVCGEVDWDYRVMHEFLDPEVGLVGFGGATRHGSPDLYVKPFVISQLARGNFMSNMKDAEVHGERFRGERDVAVLDGMALFVRREVLDKIGGWPVNTPCDYFMYSEAICCQARRLGYRIRLVGVAVDHLGGKSTGLNKDFHPDYEGEHRWLAEEFKDVLPWAVSG